MKSIIFSSGLIPKVLDGSKTMTRRVIKPQPIFTPGRYDHQHWAVYTSNPDINPGGKCGSIFGWKEEIGDKEGKWVYLGRGSSGRHYDLCEPIKPKYQPGDIMYVKETYTVGKDNLPIYRADISKDSCKWQSAMYMPEKYARCKLEIMSVSVERLQEISEEDIRREGYDLTEFKSCTDFPYTWLYKLWNSIHKKPEYQWEANPFVFVYEFRKAISG